MRALGQVNALHVHTPFEQLLRGLRGELADPSRLDDAHFDERAHLAATARDGSRSGVFIARLVMGLARYTFGSPAEASAELAIVPVLHQFSALAALAEGRRDRVDDSLGVLRRLAAHAPANFAHKVALIEGDLDRALDLARAGGWSWDVALAHELRGERDLARAAYEAWGAVGKARRL